MPSEFKSNELGHGVHSQRGLTEDEKKSIGERISLIGTMLFGSEPGSKHGPSPGLAGVLLGMRANTLIGPKRLQQFTNIIDKMKPAERDVRVKEGGPRLGRGAYGTAYTLPNFPDVVMKRGKEGRSAVVKEMLEEAMDLKNTASDPSGTIKKYLGTVGVLNQNKDFGSTYGDLLDMIKKGQINASHLSRLDLFTKQFPSQEGLTRQSQPNLDQLREFANFLSRKGLQPKDLHSGNVKYDPSQKRVGLVDLGLPQRAPGFADMHEVDMPGAAREGGTIVGGNRRIRFSPSEIFRNFVDDAHMYAGQGGTGESFEEVYKRLLKNKLQSNQPEPSRIQDLRNTINEIIQAGKMPRRDIEPGVDWFGGR